MLYLHVHDSACQLMRQQAAACYILSARALHCAHRWRRAATAVLCQSAQRPPVGKVWALANGGAVIQGQVMPQEQTAVFCADLQGSQTITYQQCRLTFQALQGRCACTLVAPQWNLWGTPSRCLGKLTMSISM